jgi:phosphohistidine phosphatase
MDLYLIQHGQALTEEQDAQRPLSDEGRSAATKVAGHLSELGDEPIKPPISEVRHSGKLRAQQTAEIYARALCPHVTPTAHDGMNPKDDPEAVFEVLHAGRGQPSALMLVGHLPHLARLTGLLLTGDAEKTPVRFVNAGVLKLCSTETGWAINWYITPACVPQPAK